MNNTLSNLYICLEVVSLMILTHPELGPDPSQGGRGKSSLDFAPELLGLAPRPAQSTQQNFGPHHSSESSETPSLSLTRCPAGCAVLQVVSPCTAALRWIGLIGRNCPLVTCLIHAHLHNHGILIHKTIAIEICYSY